MEMTTELNELGKLLELAWIESRDDIFNVFLMLVGAGVVFVVFVVFFLLNFGFNFVPTDTAIPQGMNIANCMFISAVYGLINTVYTVLFIAIIVCLFEYALAFTTICYYYDNCSWSIPNGIRTIGKSIGSAIISFQKNTAMVSKVQSDALKKKVSEIKTPPKKDTL